MWSGSFRIVRRGASRLPFQSSVRCSARCSVRRTIREVTTHRGKSRKIRRSARSASRGRGDGVLPLRDPLILSSQSDDVVAKRRSRLPLRTVVKGVNLHIGQRQVGPYLPCKRRLADACRTRHQDSLRLSRQRIGSLQDRHSSKGRFEARRHSCVGWFCRADSVEQVPSQRFEDSLRGTFAFGARSHEDSDVHREPGWVGYQAPP